MDKTIDRIPVNSSAISSIAYADEGGILEAVFRSGDVYRFSAVPAAVWTDLMRAESKGAFFNRRIRDRYPYQLVKPSRRDDLLDALQRSVHATKSGR